MPQHEIPQPIPPDQAAHWNGGAGRAWVEMQTLLDGMYQPFEDLLADRIAAVTPGGRVLDVGCGTGGLTVAVARKLHANGQCIGVDISEPMIAAARARAQAAHSPATFLCANAQSHAFEPAGFDAILSRFGVMFFDDPIQAFQNLRRAATDRAMLHCVTWRGPLDNPFMTTAERAASPLLPGLLPRKPNAAGQFGFADPLRVRTILEESGWAGVDIRPLDIVCAFPATELVRYITRFGPVGLALEEADEHTRAQVIEIVRPAFEAYVDGDAVRFTAACWMVSARAS